MKTFLIIAISLLVVLTSCQKEPKEQQVPKIQKVEVKDNLELQKMADQDQKDRMTDSDEPLEPKDEMRRKKVFEMLAKNLVVTAKDKFNAAIILQHTGLTFCEGKLTSISVENYYLVYLLAKKSFEMGNKTAQYFIAAAYDRYSWLKYGYQKYGTQGTPQDGKEVWVKIDPNTTDEERAKYRVPPLAELLKQKPMQK